MVYSLPACSRAIIATHNWLDNSVFSFKSAISRARLSSSMVFSSNSITWLPSPAVPASVAGHTCPDLSYFALSTLRAPIGTHECHAEDSLRVKASCVWSLHSLDVLRLPNGLPRLLPLPSSGRGCQEESLSIPGTGTCPTPGVLSNSSNLSEGYGRGMIACLPSPNGSRSRSPLGSAQAGPARRPPLGSGPGTCSGSARIGHT